MLVNLRKRILLSGFWIFIFLFYCIQENESNPSLQLALVQSQLQTIPRREMPELKACLVNTRIASGTITTCYEVEKESCNLDFFNNIKTPTILQNRRDDLTFISINFPNCAAGTAPLFVKYSNLQTPASMLWKDSFGFDGANVESQFQFTNQKTCKDLGLETNPFIAGEFSRLLNSQELSRLNSIEAELALIPTTDAACKNDLNFSVSLIDLTQNIKNGTFLRGITCAYQIGSAYPICPWSR
ncbi:hypothetical protein M9Y82_03690 [Leptospira weilii]|uniref:LA_1694 family PerA/PerB upregulated protein n=1 Tax=Leptospira weilii TaxID=28184 RepID=UPI00024861E3|nr:hypothetical protein [Leptospira weilii]MCL8265766.1 hypothetical protein [Leptospira weilii]MDL5245532.1 hypothetical protein [Leptospira weilii]ULH26891.1 hypothetical protein FH586_01380 [Leptospira weilii]UPY80639.1 hypothetical protein FH581_021370 [Leptospira weilii]